MSAEDLGKSFVWGVEVSGDEVGMRAGDERIGMMVSGAKLA